MTNFNLNDNRADQSSPDQFDQGFDNDQLMGTDTRKPINRNVVVLLLIAVVGASMIYLMYLRGRFNAEQQSAEQAQATETVNIFMQGGNSSIDKLEQDLARTERQVAMFQQDISAGQIPPEDLKVNPFSFGQTAKVENASEQQAVVISTDALEPVRNAVAKAKIQMILYSGNNSSVTMNNWVYRTGDRLQIDNIQFTVKSIGPRSIVLSHSSGEYVVEAPGTGM